MEQLRVGSLSTRLGYRELGVVRSCLIISLQFNSTLDVYPHQHLLSIMAVFNKIDIFKCVNMLFSQSHNTNNIDDDNNINNALSMQEKIKEIGDKQPEK